MPIRLFTLTALAIAMAGAGCEPSPLHHHDPDAAEPAPCDQGTHAMNIAVTASLGYTPPTPGELVFTAPGLVGTGPGLPVISKISDIRAYMFSLPGTADSLTPVGVLALASTRGQNPRAGVAINDGQVLVSTYVPELAAKPQVNSPVMAFFQPFIDAFVFGVPNAATFDALPAATLGVVVGTWAETIPDPDAVVTGLYAANIDVRPMGAIVRRGSTTIPENAYAFCGSVAVQGSSNFNLAFASPGAAGLLPVGIGIVSSPVLPDQGVLLLVPAYGSFVSPRGTKDLSTLLAANTPLWASATCTIEAAGPSGDHVLVGPYGLAGAASAGEILQGVTWAPVAITVTTP